MKTKSLAIIMVGCLAMAGCKQDHKITDTAVDTKPAPTATLDIAYNETAPPLDPAPGSTPNNDLNKSNPMLTSATAPP